MVELIGIEPDQVPDPDEGKLSSCYEAPNLTRRDTKRMGDSRDVHQSREVRSPRW